MSLYGLDIIVDRKGNYHLAEINGVNSGMRGFQLVYGDDRVQQQVASMLAEKHGKLTANDGTYALQKFRKEHPIRSIMIRSLLKVPYFRKRLLAPPEILRSSKAHSGWMYEDVKDPGHKQFTFETYEGQESTVLNIVNEQLPHPLVNSYVAEAISKNKFLQYLVLKDSESRKILIPTTVVGLGLAHEGELEKMLKGSSRFIIKPLLGSQGLGFKLLSREDAEYYKHLRGPVENIHPSDVVLAMAGKKTQGTYVEDLVSKRDFTFEYGLSVLQPFVDSSSTIDGQRRYGVVRAIVCNGQFVDAYMRTSPEPRVNLAQGAEAVRFNDKDLSRVCEKITAEFEAQCGTYSPENFRKTLWTQFIESKGRTSESQRRSDAMEPLTTQVMGMLGRIVLR